MQSGIIFSLIQGPAPADFAEWTGAHTDQFKIDGSSNTQGG